MLENVSTANECEPVHVLEDLFTRKELSIPKVFGPNQIKGNEYWWRPDKDHDWKGEVRFIDNEKFLTRDLPGDFGPEVVKVANERFERNVWRNFKEWMGKRATLAKDYAAQSKYFITQERLLDQRVALAAAEVPSTVGFTYAKFNRSDFEGRDILKRLEELLDEHAQPKPGHEKEVAEIRTKILPGEETLGILFHREYDHQGNGVLIEYRTNSKDVASPERTADEGKIWMVTEGMKVFKDHPELYDKRVNVTYADQSHRALYRRQYGMDVQSESTPLDRPVTISNRNGDTLDWWVVDGTLKKWESQLFNLRGFRVVEGLNQPHPFELHGFPEKRIAEASPRSTIAFDTEGNVTHADLNADTEIAPGLFVAKGGRVDWRAKLPVSVHDTAKPLEFKFQGMNFVFPESSNVTFDNHVNIGFVTKDRNSPLTMDPRGFPAVTAGSSLQGIPVPETDLVAEWVNFDHAVSEARMRVMKTTDLGNGIIPSPQTELRMTVKNGKWHWTHLQLNQDVVIDGVQFKKGWKLYRRNGRIDGVQPPLRWESRSSDPGASVPDVL